MIIKITQYLRPNGRKKQMELEIPDKYKDQYHLILSCDCEITCEQLMSKKAIQYISHDRGDFDIRMTNSFGPAYKALLDMISNFDKDKFDEWLGQQE